MPLFYRIKGPDGKFSMVEKDTSEPAPVPVVAPSSVSQEVVGVKRWSCSLCPDKHFGSAGVASMHFAKAHGDLKQHKDSWRQYVKEFGVL